MRSSWGRERQASVKRRDSKMRQNSLGRAESGEEGGAKSLCPVGGWAQAALFIPLICGHGRRGRNEDGEREREREEKAWEGE